MDFALHQVRITMIYKSFFQVTLIYFDFTSAEMVAAERFDCKNSWHMWLYIGQNYALLY